MIRILIFIVVPLIAAAAGVWSLIDFWLGGIMRPGWPVQVSAAWFAAFAFILVGAVLAISPAWKGTRWRVVRLVAGLVIIAAAAVAPWYIGLTIADQAEALQQANGADAEMEFQSSYLDESEDIDARTTSKQVFTGDEALAFLEFAAGADLTWQNLPDHTPETFDLVSTAFDAGILDPNALLKPPTADTPAETVTLAFYEKDIQPGSPNTVDRHAWDLLQVLIAHGADVSSPDAARLRADLARKVVPGSGRYVQLR